MGLFSKKKEVVVSQSEKSVPETLPDTALDKISPGFGHSSDYRKIPPEIVNEQEVVKSRVPVQETHHYVNVPAPVEEVKVEREKIPLPRENFDSKHSFFRHLEDFLKRKDRRINEYSSKDLLNKMKEYHESLKKNDHFFLHEGDAEDQIYRKMDELKELEDDWLVRRKEHDAAEMFLAEKELEIESKFEELKRLMGHADSLAFFEKKAPPGKEFVLVNGDILSSINDLFYALPRMRDEVFFYHVSNGKNDFASWVKWVFGSEEFAKVIGSAKTKLDMIKKLKDF